MPALQQILLDTEIICKPNVCKAMFAARKLHSSELVNWFAKKITNLNPRLLLLQRKEREREPGNEVEKQSQCQTMSLQSRNISCCSFTHSQRIMGDFKMAATSCIVGRSEVNILVHWSDLFYSLHDALFYWFFYCSG